MLRPEAQITDLSSPLRISSADPARSAAPEQTVSLSNRRPSMRTARRVLDSLGAFLYLITFSLPLIVLFLAACVFSLYRPLVGLFLRRKHGARIAFLPGLDAMCAIDCEQSPMNVTAILTLTGRADVDKLRRIVLRQLVRARDHQNAVRHPSLTHYVHQECGFYFWLPEVHFSIHDHVQLYEGPCPSNEDEFDAVCADICTRRAPSGKSPWLFLLVPLAPDFPTTENPDRPHYRIVLSLLHAMADGVSLVRIITEHLLDEPYTQIPGVLLKKNDESALQSVVHALKTAFFLPRAIYKQLMIADANPLHGRELSGVKLVAFSQPTPLERVQRVRRATATTVNDVLMSCVAGALRSYFGADSTRAATAIVPIAKHDLAKEAEMKNSCSFVPFSLPVHVEDAMVRLEETKRGMDGVKRSPNFWFNFYGFQFLCNRVPKCVSRLYLNTLRITCIVSNVPGCDRRHTMCDNDAIEGAAFILPNRGKIGVGVSLLTFNNYLQVGLIVDQSLVHSKADLRTILANFETELQMLEKRTAQL